MNSGCSSGCESGWTLYLEQSLNSTKAPSHRGNIGFGDAKGTGFCDDHYEGKRVIKEEIVDEEEEEEEEEDLSMVSDASSGPPHFNEDVVYLNDDYGFQYPASRAATLPKNIGGKKQRKKEHQELPSFLDDTASSPLINFSNNNFAMTNNQASMESALDYSQGFSATHFQGSSTFQNHFGFFQSSLPGNQLQNNQWF